LTIMAESRRAEWWEHTSSLLAMTVNAARDPKKSSFVRPDQLNPYRNPAPKAIPKLKGKELRILKDIFCRSRE